MSRPPLPLIPSPAALPLQLGPMALIRQPAFACGLGYLGLLAHARRLGAALEDRRDLLQAELAVLELAARLARGHGDARGNMRHAHRGIRGVHTLAARALRPKHLHLAVPRKLVGTLLGVARVITPVHDAPPLRNDKTNPVSFITIKGRARFDRKDHVKPGF